MATPSKAAAPVPTPDSESESAAPVGIIEALSRVMDEVRAVGKDERNQSQNFNFRGIDAVMNAVGPALRKHGVVIAPFGAVASFDEIATSGGKAWRLATVNVSYRVFGPEGDFIEGQMLGEAADMGDKAVSKATSVAYRQFLLQLLCLPTTEQDPDHTVVERVTAQRAQAEAVSDRVGEAYRALGYIARETDDEKRIAAVTQWKQDYPDVQGETKLHEGATITLARLADNVMGGGATA